MSKGSKRRPGEGYEDGHTKAFGEDKVERGSWIWDSAQGKLVPKSQYSPQECEGSAAVHGPIEPFISPVDGSVIDDRKKLRDHNRAHGVTNVADYGNDWFKRRGQEKYQEMTGQNAKAKKERIEMLKHAYDKQQRNR